MTGFEYAAAGLMLVNGYVDECETMVKAIRDRYDGEKRNPWDEIECGHNYARTMASYALMPLWSGFTFDMTEKYIGFTPITQGDGQYVWSIGNTWGKVRFEGKKCVLTVLGDSLTLASFGVYRAATVAAVSVDGVAVPYAVSDKKITFDAECVITNELVIETV